EADVRADFGKTNAADQLSLRRPHGDAVVADRAPRVARAPQVAVDVAPDAVRAALHAVDHEIGEALHVRGGAVGVHVHREHIAAAAGPGVARSLAGADN